jgi:hypothetical protein
VLRVSCGAFHTAVLVSDAGQQSLLTFGMGRGGQLGLGRTVDCKLPQRVPTFVIEGGGGGGSGDGALEPQQLVVPAEQVTVLDVACGLNHTLVLARRDLGEGGAPAGESAAVASVWACGWGEHGRLGLGDENSRSLPTLVSALSAGAGVSSVAAGSQHSLARLASGAVFGWGSNEFGQLGTGTSMPFSSTPVRVQLPDGSGGASEIAAGGNHSAAITADSRQLFTWGWGEQGQLGHGGDRDSNLPRPVKLPLDAVPSAVACGSSHTLVLCTSAESGLSLASLREAALRSAPLQPLAVEAQPQAPPPAAPSAKARLPPRARAPLPPPRVKGPAPVLQPLQRLPLPEPVPESVPEPVPEPSAPLLLEPLLDALDSALEIVHSPARPPTPPRPLSPHEEEVEDSEEELPEHAASDPDSLLFLTAIGGTRKGGAIG